MPRAIHRRDSTHTSIIKALREHGFGCVSTANLGGFPGDIVVAVDGVNLILEVKPEEWTKPRNDRERDQQEMRKAWVAIGGQVEVVRNVFEALQFVQFGLGPGLE